jgi:hypothetical protein
VEVLKLNVEAYPDSFNVYDSLAEAYMNRGDRDGWMGTRYPIPSVV